MPPKKFKPVIKQHTVRQDVTDTLQPVTTAVQPAPVVPVEAPAPVVVAPQYVTVYEVRLRKEDMPLVVSVDGEEHERQVTYKSVLIPNKWMVVSECINTLLKTKFALREDTRMVPDAIENQKNPHGRNGDTIMREEDKPGYIIEFREHQREIHNG